MAAVAQEEAARALQQYKIDDKIKSIIEAELEVKIKQEIDVQFADMRKAVKIMNEQILILKDAVETLSKKYNS
jgi:flagellar capping protein FliD